MQTHRNDSRCEQVSWKATLPKHITYPEDPFGAGETHHDFNEFATVPRRTMTSDQSWDQSKVDLNPHMSAPPGTVSTASPRTP